MRLKQEKGEHLSAEIRSGARPVLKMLDAVAKERTAEAAGSAPVYVPYVPQVIDTTAPRDL
jgi:uncharacterized protein